MKAHLKKYDCPHKMFFDNFMPSDLFMCGHVLFGI